MIIRSYEMDRNNMIRSFSGSPIPAIFRGENIGRDIVLVPPLVPHGVYDALADFLSHRFRTVCIPMPGLDGEDANARHYSLARLADDLLVVVESLESAPCVFGWCLGAMVAVAAAYRKPEAIGHLILMAPPSGTSRRCGIDECAEAKGMTNLSAMVWNNEQIAAAVLALVLKNNVDTQKSKGRRYAESQMNAVFLNEPAAFKNMHLLQHQAYQNEEYWDWLPRITTGADVLLAEEDEIISAASGIAVAARMGALGSVKRCQGDHFSVLVDSVLHELIADTAAAYFSRRA